MAISNNRRWNGLVLAVGAMALPAALTTGCFGGPMFNNGDDDKDIEDPWEDDWWEDECGGMGSSSGMGGAGMAAPPAMDARQAIGEADIIKIEGDLIYALSRERGLTVVDGADADHLKVLDNHDPLGEEFEMYVRDGVVHTMSTYMGDTRIQTIDATDPTSLGQKAHASVPGEISDSRLIGDVLYVVTFDPDPEGSWSGNPVTFVTSLSLNAPAGLGQVDQIGYVDSDPHDFGWKRTVYATNDRMYVAGVEWDNQENDGHSKIQVVDISDPSGELVEGATIEPAGQIYSRWQLSERDGILRVISSLRGGTHHARFVVRLFDLGHDHSQGTAVIRCRGRRFLPGSVAWPTRSGRLARECSLLEASDRRA